MKHSGKNKAVNPIFKAAREFQIYFNRRRWPFCFIGGLAVLRWGENRMTQDIDICLLCGYGNEEKFIRLLSEHFRSRLSDPVSFAMKNRVLLLYSGNNVPVDIILSGISFEEAMIRRATKFSFQPRLQLLTCSAEDLIVLKAFAGRSKDWSDIESIIKRNYNKLDTGYIFKQLKPLAEINDGATNIHQLKALFRLQTVIK